MKAARSLHLCLLLLASPAARADVFTVTNNGDGGAGSLRDAIAQANAHPGLDDIRFSTAATSILLTTNSLAILDDVRILNAAAAQVTIARDAGAPAFGIFSIGSGLRVTLHGLDILRGSSAAGGGIAIASSALSASSLWFDDNSSSGNGGAIAAVGSDLTLANTTFTDNAAAGAGGALDISGGTAAVHQSSFSGNSAASGALGGGAIANRTAGVITLFHNNVLAGNSTAGQGGGIFNTATLASIRSSVLASNTASMGGNDYRDAGTTSAAAENVVQDAAGHTLTEPPNKIGSNPGSAALVFIGPIPALRITPSPPDIITDKGSNPDAGEYDGAGGFRKIGAAPDVGVIESGNRHMLSSGAVDAPASWLDGALPNASTPAWINRAVTADAAGLTVEAASLGIGWGGGLNAEGTLQGAGVSMVIDTKLGIGIGDPAVSFFTRGVGTLNITGSVGAGSFTVGSAVANRDDRIAEARGSATIGAAPANLLSVSTLAQIGQATASGLRSSAIVEDAKLDFTGTEAAFSSSVIAGQALAGETASAKVEGVTFRMATSGPFSASSFTVADASSFGGSAEVTAATVTITADQVTSDFTSIGNASTSASTAGNPAARIGIVLYTATANGYAAGNALRIGNASVSNFGAGGGTAQIDSVTATFDTGSLTADQLDLGTISVQTGAPGSVLMPLVAMDGLLSTITINGPINIGTVSVNGGASVSRTSVILDVNGFFSTTGPAGDVSIGDMTLSGVNGPLTGGPARFTLTDASASISGSVSIGNVTGTGSAAAGSAANAELRLVNTRLGISGDLQIGFESKPEFVLDVQGYFSDPSFTDVGGSLLLGDGAELHMDITGLTRSTLAALGSYSAIDAANATLDGDLVAEFNFPAVQPGHVFEVIRLDAGGVFTGSFDSVSATGLPFDFTVQPQIAGQSFNLIVVPEPSSAALAALAAAMLGAVTRSRARAGRR